MQKSLILVRHAQSVSSLSGLKDIERSLTDKGIRDAYKTGKYIFRSNLKPELIYTSHALRAISTSRLIAEQTGLGNHQVISLEDLYESSVRIMLRIVNELKTENECVLITGHNPSISFLCEFLTNETIPELLPGGLCIIGFNVPEWSQIDKSSGKLIDIKSPDDIIL